MDENNTEKRGAKGGKARAENLTSEQRRDIARHAALARWDSSVPQASHEGILKIGGKEISAAVLPTGQRLITQGTFLRALGRSRSPKAGTGILSTVDGLPFFLQAEVLKPYISEELRMSTTPLFFRTKEGKKSVGYDAEVLPMVCEVYLKFRDACLQQKEGKDAKIPTQYQHIIIACDVLMRGLAHVGIIALVDEATGFQDFRAKEALQAILDRYLRKEFAAWAKRFPDEFYQQIFRLKGWTWKGMQKNRPQVVANYTKDLVYERLAPGILKELETRNPVDEKGKRRHKHHQWLTEDVGHPALAQHLYAVIAFMRVAPDRGWERFKRTLDLAFPKKGDTLSFEFMNADAQTNGS